MEPLSQYGADPVLTPHLRGEAKDESSGGVTYPRVEGS